MSKKLALVLGLPRMVAEAATPSIYDKEYSPLSDITAGTNVILPAGGTYTSNNLEIALNGQWLAHPDDFTYVGSPPRTQVQFTSDIKGGFDKLRFRVDTGGADFVYEEVYDVVSDIPAGTPITLPSGGTYTSDDLEVWLNGQGLVSIEDYNYVGSPVRSQIEMTFDLVGGVDKIKFRVDRNP